MNDERYPHPNGHHDNDLRPERRADASATEADALDALLNEIAQGNGSPNPRSRSGQDHGHERQRPDVRTETGAANSLPAAARAFHRRIETAESRDPGFVALDPHLWETIMTASSTAATGAEPARGALRRTAAQPARVSPPPTRSRTHLPDPRQPGRWAPVANATLALIILLAGFGVWRAYDGLYDSGPTDPARRIAGLAAQPGTPGSPEPTEPPVVAAPPVATPAPITACDFGADIPIFPGVDASPIDGTALLLTTTGDLVLACPEEPDPTVLASGIDYASPMNWPGIVSLVGKGPRGSEPISILNVITGERVEIGVPPDSVRYGWTQPEGSPWLVAPSNEVTGDWNITDLRTMESRRYSEFVDSPLPSGAILNPAAANGETGDLVIASWTFDNATGTGAVSEHSGRSSRLLVFRNALDEAHFVDLPADLAQVSEFRLAPDGRHLAVKSTEDGDLPTGNTTYTIVNADDGTEIARTDAFEGPMSTMRWVQGGDALVYTNNTSLMLMSASSGTKPVTLLESSDALVEFGTTYDEDVVIVHHQQAEEIATETPSLVQPRIHSVNTVSGETIEIDGVDVSHNVSPWEPDTRFLVMGDTYIQHMDAEVATFRVVDAVTGEVLGELSDIQISQDPNAPMMGLRSVVSTDDGSTEVIGFGASQIYLLREVGGTVEIRQLPSPNPDIASYIGSVPLSLSSDGDQLSLTIDGEETGPRYLIDLPDLEADWLAVPSPIIEPGYGPASIFFVPGTGE